MGGAGKARVTGWIGGAERYSGDIPSLELLGSICLGLSPITWESYSRPWYLALPPEEGCRVGKVISLTFVPCIFPNLPHPPEKSTSPLPALPLHSYPPLSNPAALIFLLLSTSLGRKSAPQPQPRVPEAIYKRQELKGTAQPSWQKHLWV